MNMNNVVIVSLKKLQPVKSGFQNTVHMLFLALKKKYKVHFIFFENENDIDPVFNLSFNENFNEELQRQLSFFSPDYVFVNTTKLLHLYRKTFFESNSNIILVCHDLYYFRKEYFRENKFIDSTPLKKEQEIDCLSRCKFIIDFSHYEQQYLISSGIKKEKLIFTSTPVKVEKFSYSKARYFDYFLIGSNWKQNTLSVERYFLKFKIFFSAKKVKVVGMRFANDLLTFSFVPSLRKSDFLDSKIGLAPIFEGTGRNVKIFSMMGYGLPVVTNKELSKFGLVDGIHYVYVKSLGEWEKKLKELEENFDLRHSIAFNGWNWVKKNSDYKVAFNNLINSC